MDDVEAGQVHDDRLVDRQVELVDGVDVVGPGGVAAVQADRVGRGDQARVAAPERAVGAGVDGVPFELLRDDVHHRRALLRRERVDAHRPRGDGEEQQDDGFDDGHADFEVARRVALDAGVVGLGIRRGAEANQRVDEERPPADEQHGHEPVDDDDDPVDLRRVRRRLQRQPEKFLHRYTPGPSWNPAASRRREATRGSQSATTGTDRRARRSPSWIASTDREKSSRRRPARRR